jgi:hypothetical protein
MKILQSKNKKIFVMTNPPQDTCPRLAFSKGSVKVKDDYRGCVRLNRSLLKKLV